MENSIDPSYVQHHEQPHQQPKVSRSLAYIFSTIALLTAVANLTVILVTWSNGSFTDNGVSFETIAFPTACLIVALPIFTFFLMDLERAEQKNSQLKLSPYKKYSVQFVKVVAFTACFFTLIGLVFGIFLSAAATSSGSWLPRLFTDCLIILAVAGGLLAYATWNDRQKP